MRQANGKRKKADLSDCEKISLALSSRYPSCCAEYRDDQIKKRNHPAFAGFPVPFGSSI